LKKLTADSADPTAEELETQIQVFEEEAHLDNKEISERFHDMNVNIE